MFQLVLGKKKNIELSVPKTKETIQSISATGAQANICHCMGYISAHGHGITFVEGTITLHMKVTLRLRHILRLYRDICCNQNDDFSREFHGY